MPEEVHGPLPRRRTSLFLKEFVVLVGFLNGVWAAVGVNPGETLLETLEGFLVALVGASGLLAFVFALLPAILLVGTLFLILRKGGWLGLVAVVVAFLGGMQVVSNPQASLLLLLVAFALGYFATR